MVDWLIGLPGTESHSCSHQRHRASCQDHGRSLGNPGPFCIQLQGCMPQISRLVSPEWETGLDSTKTDPGTFQNKGVGPLSHSNAVYMEEAELLWKLARHENQLIPSPSGSSLHLCSCSRLFLSPPWEFSLLQASFGMMRSCLKDLMPLYWLLPES